MAGKKEPNHITEFKQLLEDHVPMVIFPFGLKEYESFRAIGEGFLFGAAEQRKDGFYWMDAGWQVSMSGYQAEHALYGKLSKPVKGRAPNDWEQYWELNDARGAVIVQIKRGNVVLPVYPPLPPTVFASLTPGAVAQYIDLPYESCKANKKLAKEKEDQEYGSRKAAKVFMMDYGRLDEE